MSSKQLSIENQACIQTIELSKNQAKEYAHSTMGKINRSLTSKYIHIIENIDQKFVQIYTICSKRNPFFLHQIVVFSRNSNKTNLINRCSDKGKPATIRNCPAVSPFHLILLTSLLILKYFDQRSFEHFILKNHITQLHCFLTSFGQ